MRGMFVRVHKTSELGFAPTDLYDYQYITLWLRSIMHLFKNYATAF